jgi:hypothetical protein
VRKTLTFLAAIILTTLAYIPAGLAQTPPQVDSTVVWTNPTTDTNGQALTGANAIQKIQVFVASSPILDASTIAPFAELIVGQAPAPGTSLIYHASAGSTVYARVKACNATGCSVFSNQASKVVPFPAAVPNAPTNVDIVILVTPPTAENGNVGTLSILTAQAAE